MVRRGRAAASVAAASVAAASVAASVAAASVAGATDGKDGQGLTKVHMGSLFFLLFLFL